MYHVYVLISLQDRKLYIGKTKNITERILRHNAGYVPATKYRQPLKLIYLETYLTEQEASRREKYLKGGNGRSSLKQQIKESLINHSYRFMSKDL